MHTEQSRSLFPVFLLLRSLRCIGALTDAAGQTVQDEGAATLR
jgi:hypothetical protein